MSVNASLKKLKTDYIDLVSLLIQQTIDRH